ncbi:MAG: ABC transporter substrate-binding protein [Deltaproteobacteria bacterium]|jgi:ABC-type nitrate/sulfonate/bicarbonate transport system substrate-binding protein|nr:ABC transporter substrate-binding protein [Deltaproteobacteria bacterium]
MKIYISIILLLLAGVVFIASRGEDKSASQGFNLAPAVSSSAANSVSSSSSASPAPADLAEGEIWENGQKYFVLNVPNSANLLSPEIFMAGEENGFFAENGIKLNYVGAVPNPQAIPSVLKGIIHVNSGGHVNTTISAISAGAKIKAVSAKTETTERIPHMVAIVKKDSQIKTATDLVGKKFASTTSQGCSGYFHLAYMKKNGIPDVKNASELVVLKEQVIEQALRQGDINIGLMHKNPIDYVTNDEFDVIFTDYDIWENRGGGVLFYLSLDFINKRPDIVRKFVDTMARTVNWANAHPQENREITARRFKADINVVKEAYYAPNAIILPETVTVWVDLLKEFKEIPGDVPLEKIYTNEFNPYFKG